MGGAGGQQVLAPDPEKAEEHPEEHKPLRLPYADVHVVQEGLHPVPAELQAEAPAPPFRDLVGRALVVSE